jgi:hypothetical protein
VAALWEQRSYRYRGFEHLEARLIPAERLGEPGDAPRSLPASESCGYELTSRDASFTILSGSWNVPNLNHTSAAVGPIHFRTLFGLGFLDVHVEMTVDAAQNVTSRIRIHDGTQVALTVSPGDTISATLCLRSDGSGTAHYFLANETTAQTMFIQIETVFPAAARINAGVSRGRFDGPPDPLTRFGAVYFDEVLAFSTSGTGLITDGTPTTMVDSSGTVLAKPQRLNDHAFKAVCEIN